FAKNRRKAALRIRRAELSLRTQCSQLSAFTSESGVGHVPRTLGGAPMNRTRIASLIGLTTLAAACHTQPNAGPPAPPRSRTASLRNTSAIERAASLGGRITSIDDNGLPQFLWATTARPVLPGQNA